MYAKYTANSQQKYCQPQEGTKDEKERGEDGGKDIMHTEN